MKLWVIEAQCKTEKNLFWSDCSSKDFYSAKRGISKRGDNFLLPKEKLKDGFLQIHSTTLLQTFYNKNPNLHFDNMVIATLKSRGGLNLFWSTCINLSLK